jgi:hypothetical protein
MPVATNQQVQNFSDQKVRPLCEQFVSFVQNLQMALSQMGDINANLTATNPTTTWLDVRTDAPPHLAQPGDLLAVAAASAAFGRVLAGTGTAQDSVTIATAIPIIQSLCVRSQFTKPPLPI